MRRQFRYIFDPACVAATGLFALGKFHLRPHHIGGWFVHGYWNDVLCLPLFVPWILLAQRVCQARRHDGFPRLWEVGQAWAVFSVLFEVVLPRYPKVFATTGDPWDVVAYGVGGAVAWGWWRWVARRRSPATEVVASETAEVQHAASYAAEGVRGS